jgi:hypothetical protein
VHRDCRSTAGPSADAARELDGAEHGREHRGGGGQHHGEPSATVAAVDRREQPRQQGLGRGRGIGEIAR